ncbi:MAG TPA: TolC family protein [Bacteroidia bacterium]|nr:TolC family protein [Bacteroidia bacterium]
MKTGNRSSLFKVFIFIAGCTLAAVPIKAQQTVTLKQALDSALQRSPAVQAAALQTIQSRQLQKSSVSLDNPEVVAESPSGEFYTIGVQQSFDFPGTYVRQHQYQKEQTKLSGFAQAISAIEVKREVGKLYLDIQYQQARLVLLNKQDSLYRSISEAAVRTFNAGKLDYIQRTFAEVQSAEVHLRYEQAKADYVAAQEQLALFTGIAAPFGVDPLAASLVREPLQVSLAANPYVGFYAQQGVVSKRLLQVERNRFMPGFMFGYLNQGPANTPVSYRFRAGITVPLWFWQYTGRIQAARTGIQIAEQQSLAQQQQFSSQLIGARAEQSKSTLALIYYEETGLNQAKGIEDAAGRIFNAGQSDYTTYLRTLNDAYNIRFNHIEATRNYNWSVIQLNYLSGNL